MTYKYCCVIDGQGRYVALVLVVDGAPQNYEPAAGERLIDAVPPVCRAHAGVAGLINPRWDGTAWAETATAEEIAAWAVEHPAPDPAPPNATEINAVAIAETQASVGDQIELSIDLDYRLSLVELGLV